MPLIAYSAHSSCADPERLHVGVNSRDKLGMIFSPTWELHLELLIARTQCMRKLAELRIQQEKDPKSQQCASLDFELGVLTSAFKGKWQGYADAYREEMRRSYGKFKDQWKEILDRGTVIFVCDCDNHRICHRSILAEEILPKLGAHFGSELTPTIRIRSQSTG